MKSDTAYALQIDIEDVGKRQLKWLDKQEADKKAEVCINLNGKKYLMTLEEFKDRIRKEL